MPHPILPFSELADFINAQDDSRPIRMREADFSYPTGCILVQFGRAKYGDRCYSGCGYSSIGVRGEGEDDGYGGVEFESPTSKFLSEHCRSGVFTFGDAKKRLAEFKV